MYFLVVKYCNKHANARAITYIDIFRGTLFLKKTKPLKL